MRANLKKKIKWGLISFSPSGSDNDPRFHDGCVYSQGSPSLHVHLNPHFLAYPNPMYRCCLHTHACGLDCIWPAYICANSERGIAIYVANLHSSFYSCANSEMSGVIWTQSRIYISDQKTWVLDRAEEIRCVLFLINKYWTCMYDVLELITKVTHLSCTLISSFIQGRSGLIMCWNRKANCTCCLCVSCLTKIKAMFFICTLNPSLVERVSVYLCNFTGTDRWRAVLLLEQQSGMLK